MLAFRFPLAPIDIPFVPFAIRERKELEAKLAQQLLGTRAPPPTPMFPPTLAERQKSIRDTADLIHLKEAELTSVISAMYVLHCTF